MSWAPGGVGFQILQRSPLTSLLISSAVLLQVVLTASSTAKRISTRDARVPIATAVLEQTSSQSLMAFSGIVFALLTLLCPVVGGTSSSDVLILLFARVDQDTVQARMARLSGLIWTSQIFSALLMTTCWRCSSHIFLVTKLRDSRACALVGVTLYRERTVMKTSGTSCGNGILNRLSLIRLRQRHGKAHRALVCCMRAWQVWTNSLTRNGSEYIRSTGNER